MAYFSATVRSVEELMDDSTVVAVFDKLPTGPLPVPRKLRRTDKVKRRPPTSTRFKPELKRDITLRYKNGMPEGQDSKVELKLKLPAWKRLTQKYYKRQPESKKFFRKRTNDKSARLAFKTEAATWKSKVNSVSSYNKGKMSVIKTKVNHKWVSTFSVNYPTLNSKFNFIRLAFLHGLANTSTSIENLQTSGGSEGIVYAEKHRPIMRPVASEMGKRLREAFKKVEKTKEF
jgi:hypothetical protein